VVHLCAKLGRTNKKHHLSAPRRCRDTDNVPAAPADWSAEDTNQDIEEVYGRRIDMVDQYPAPPATGPAASPEARTSHADGTYAH
jgi:hypothetical protein